MYDNGTVTYTQQTVSGSVTITLSTREVQDGLLKELIKHIRAAEETR